MIGQTVSHFRILSRIGEGGMGVVYRAEDQNLRRPVALKVLPPGSVGDEERRRRFLREARAAAAVAHPNIATIYEIDEADGVVFIAMELVEGKTLRQLLCGPPLPIQDAVWIGGEIAEGLASAHQARVIHRDLKPENVIVRPDGHVKILDFGLAKLHEERMEARLSGLSHQDTLSAQMTREGRIVGTAAYMSPEQARGKAVDARSDLFAFGITLYEMATGRRPFQGASHTDTLSAILRDQPTPAGKINPKISPALEKVIGRCLEKDPERRYQSAREIQRDLELLKAPVPLLATLLRLALPRRRPLALAGIAAALVAVVAGLNVGGWRDRLFGGAATPRIESLAVLPLANLSGDPEQEYFADGMTDALITDLARIGTLRVISRGSVMGYKAAPKPVPEVARALNVDAVVEASVFRSGGRVRVNATLIPAATRQVLWAGSYERDLRDVLALQSDVARAIATEIKAKLTLQEEARLARKRPVDPAVYETYLKGQYHFNQQTVDGMLKAKQYFEEAIGKDPEFAPAYVGLADTYAWGGIPLPPREVAAQARAAAQKALELDETLAEAHVSLGAILEYEYDWVGAEREYRRAIDLNPNSANAHAWYAMWLVLPGRFEEALAEIKRAEELDPLSSLIKAMVGWIHFWSSQLDQAMEQWRKTLDLDPNFGLAHYNLGLGYLQMRMYGEAIAAFQKGIDLGGVAALPGDQVMLGAAYARAGRRGEALKMLAQLNDLSKREYVGGFFLAHLHLALDNKEQALAQLERAYQDRDMMLGNLRREWFDWEPLGDEPRFQDLLRRLNFPPRIQAGEEIGRKDAAR